MATDTEYNNSAAPEPAPVAEKTIFTRLYALPFIRDTLVSIHEVADKNQYSSAILARAENLGGKVVYSVASVPRLQGPLKTLDTLAQGSLDKVEAVYPSVKKPSKELIDSVKAYYHDTRQAYPKVAHIIDTAESTSSQVLDVVDKTVEKVLPPTENQKVEGQDSSSSEKEETANRNAPTKAFAIATKISTRVYYRIEPHVYTLSDAARHPIATAKNTILFATVTLKDTANVYKDEITARATTTFQFLQSFAKSTLESLPAYLPQHLQPYYNSSKDALTTKYQKLYTEYKRSDEDTQSKVLNLILIGGEQIPILERITKNFYDKASSARSSEPSSPTSPHHQQQQQTSTAAA
ncbi:hypothetical protein H4219_003616 [Mycoemilia scoparia]|uniref:Uncharacterized protein n=1 Tax=Mycoemilia scoparia TaxID=417184 RepID=A0A9W8DSP7_9FUNG|nr:hypothetical protein H4219_003616 [Mycoemilia scoparia]